MNKKLLWGTVIVVAILLTVYIIHLASNNNGVSSTIPADTTTAPIHSTSSTSQSNLAIFLTYDIASPNGLFLTDPSGRRVGQDPKTGTIYNEIPNSPYDLNGPPDGWEIQIGQPLPGRYMLQVIGGSTGQYSLAYGVLDGNNTVADETLTGSITSGQVITYAQNYDPDNLASSTLVLASSTD